MAKQCALVALRTKNILFVEAKRASTHRLRIRSTVKRLACTVFEISFSSFQVLWRDVIGTGYSCQCFFIIDSNLEVSNFLSKVRGAKEG